MIKQFFIKLRKFILNPYLLVFSIILISFYSMVINGWIAKDYYLDREKAQVIIDNEYEGKYTDVYNKIELLVNRKFYPLNITYNALAFSFLVLLLLVILKIKNYRDFLSLSAISNKALIFLCINFSYILFSGLFLYKSMSDLCIEVLPGSADSMGIPLFLTLGMLTMLAIPYYIFVNLVFFITCRKTIDFKINLGKVLLFYKPLFSWKYSLIVIFHILSIFICLWLLADWMCGKFYFIFPVYAAFSLVWIYINMSAIALLSNKFILNSETTKL